MIHVITRGGEQNRENIAFKEHHNRQMGVL